MHTVLLLWLLAILVGALIPVQAAANAALSRALGGHPAVVALLLFVVATLVSLVAIPLSGAPLPTGGQLRGAPWWSYTGGLIVAAYVLAITVLAARLGVGTAVVLIVSGQVLGALLIDHYGLMRSQSFPLTPVRTIGAGLMIAGAFLALRR
jgi:bacterial/archaeal transporter family-2 protein